VGFWGRVRGRLDVERFTAHGLPGGGVGGHTDCQKGRGYSKIIRMFDLERNFERLPALRMMTRQEEIADVNFGLVKLEEKDCFNRS
jgi:hypothetical protein